MRGCLQIICSLLLPQIVVYQPLNRSCDFLLGRHRVTYHRPNYPISHDQGTVTRSNHTPATLDSRLEASPSVTARIIPHDSVDGPTVSAPLCHLKEFFPSGSLHPVIQLLHRLNHRQTSGGQGISLTISGTGRLICRGVLNRMASLVEELDLDLDLDDSCPHGYCPTSNSNEE